MGKKGPKYLVSALFFWFGLGSDALQQRVVGGSSSRKPTGKIPPQNATMEEIIEENL